MNIQQVIVAGLTTILAGWCIYRLGVMGQWPLLVGCLVVPGGALVHAGVLAARGQRKAADALLTWTFASAVAFVAFAEAAGGQDCGANADAANPQTDGVP